LVSPSIFSTGVLPVVARVNNFGVNQINSVTVNWSVNGVIQTPVLHSSLLDTTNGLSPTNAAVTLGNVTFANNIMYEIKTWTSAPNSLVDTVPTNDTFTATFRSPLSGNYTIGAFGDFTTITQAANLISSAGVSGNVTFELIDPLYSTATGEVFPINFRNIPGLTANRQLTIKPQNLNTPVIRGNVTTSIFIVDNSKYVNFDGRWSASNNGRNLTIENSSTNATASVMVFRNESSASSVRNTIIRSASNNTNFTPTNAAIFVGGTTNLTGQGNDSLLFRNNIFAPSAGNYYATAIAFSGQSLTQQNDWATIDSNWIYGNRVLGISINATNSGNGRQYIIRGNSFYDTITTVPHPFGYATSQFSQIYMNSSNAASWGHQIVGNYIGGQQPFAGGPRQIVNPGTASIYTIWYNASNITGGANISGNYITNQIYNQGGVASFYYPYFFYINSGFVDITDNIIGHPTDTNSVQFDNINGVCMYMMYMFHSAPTQIKRNKIQNIYVNSNAAVGFNAIYHGTTTIGEAFIDSNIVNRIFTRSSGTSSSTCAAFQGIFVSNSSPTHYIRGNIVGGTNIEDSISVFSSNPLNPGTSLPVGTIMNGIYNSAGIAQISNNYVGHFYSNTNGTGTSTTASIVGIHQVSGTGGTLTNNNIVSDLNAYNLAGHNVYGITSLSAAATYTNNTVRNIFNNSTNTGVTTSATTNGFYISTSQVHNILNNTIFNLNTLSNSSTQTNGIMASVSAQNTIRGNNISNLISRTSNANTSLSAGIIGINNVSGAFNQVVDENNITNLISTNDAATANPSISGIVFQGNATVAGNNSSISRNRIWGLTHTYPIDTTTIAAIQYGIQIVNGTVVVANNLIRLGRDTAGLIQLRPGQYRGILSTASSNQIRVYHNNILIEYSPNYGTGGSPNPSTGCIEFTTNAFAPGFIDVRNNIFVNNSLNGGTSTLNHFNEMYSTSTALLTTNSNILSNSLSANSFVGRFAGVNRTTLNAFRTATLQAGTSGFGLVNFIAPNASTSGVNLRVGTTNAIEGMGDTTVAAFVSLDVDGQTRSSFGPVDIGASAGNYTLSADSVAPSIYYTPLSNTSSPAARTFQAVIYDGTGVPVDTSIAPRVYFKKTTQTTWVYNPGVFVSGTTKNRTYNFTINHTMLGGLSVGDVIQYYILAADTIIGNLNSNPAYAVATNIANVTTPPITPNTYLFNDPIPTLVFVGTGAGAPSYPTFTGTGGLFQAINNSALQGNTTVLVQNNVTEAGTFELNKWLEAGVGGYQLTIRPASNTQFVISSTVGNPNGMLRFNNTDNVRILGWDSTGSVNDTNLIIRASSTLTPAIGFINGGSTDTLQNVILESRTTFNGILFISPTSTTRGVSNMFLNNCWFRQDSSSTTLYSVAISGSATTPRTNNDITINNCKFLNFSNSGVSLGSGTGNNIRITNNHFYHNFGINTTTSITPILLNPSNTSNGNLISGNFIGGSTLFAQGAPWVNNASVTFTGINATTGTGVGTTINNNVIQNIRLTSTTNTSTFTGIWGQGTASAYVINNNRIGSYDFPLFSTNNGRFIGINTTGTGNITILNDTVQNIRVVNTGTIAGITGIISQSGSSNVVNINNNIVRDLYTNSGNTGTTTAAALMGITSLHSTFSININNNTVKTLVNDNASAIHSIRGIQASGGIYNINNNTVYGIFSRSTYTGTLTLASVIPIASTSTAAGTININNNTVDSVWVTNPGAISSQLIGILYNSGGTQNANVNGNTITNLNTESSNIGTTTSSALVGLLVNAVATVNSNFNDNRISVLNHLRNTGANIVGMYMATSTSVVGNNTFVQRNLVHSLRSIATLPTIQTGILNQQGFANYANNMIRMGIDSSGTLFSSPTEIRGIWHVNTTQANYYHNTVMLAGAPSSGSNNSAAFVRGSSVIAGQQMDIRNNIFVNTISNAGTATGIHVGLNLFDSLRTTSNYNIIHTPGVGGIAGRIAQFATNYTLLGGDSLSWKARLGLDIQSSSVNPNFSILATGAAPNVDLTLQTTNAAEKSGDPSLTVISTDYFNNIRSNLSPTDIGAHAGNFTLSPDSFPPAISYIPLTNAGSFVGSRSLNNVTITDNNGIITTGANRPRIYYTRDGITWLSSASVSISGTATNASANFIIDYLAFSPSLTGADTIRYFVVAQDAAGNVQSFPTLAVASDVNTIIQFPRNPSRFAFLPVIAANTVIPVGIGQTYTSLTNSGGLFEFINNRTLGGNVFVEITSDITNETGSVALNKFAEDGPGAGSFTLTIRPDALTVTPRTIQGNFSNGTANGLITVIADRLKITGIPVGGNNTQRLLRVRNAASTNNGTIVVSSAREVAIRNIIVESGNANAAGGNIEFRVGNNNLFTTTPCSFDTVTNCVLTNNKIATLPAGIPSCAGVYSFGAPNVYNNNIVMTNNEVSNFTTAGMGVVGNNGDGFIITGNSFFYDLGFVPNITGTVQGIVFIPGSFSSGNNISNNFIGGSLPNALGSPMVNPNNMGFNGIRANVGNGATTTIHNNVIRNISFTNNAATTQARLISGEAGNMSIIGNQMGHPTITNSINWATSASLFGIIYQGASNFTIQNNTLQGIALPVANTFAQFVGIYYTNGTVVGDVSGNTVGHNTTPNSITIAGNTTHYGIWPSTNAGLTPSMNITNNVVANITSTGVGASTFLYGIFHNNSAFPTIANNTVHNLRCAGISTSTNGIVNGIMIQTTATSTAIIRNNTVYAIRATNNGATPTSTYGIFQSSGQNNIISANRIYDITNASTSNNLSPAPIASGIVIGGGSISTTVANNQITLGVDNANNVQLSGIYLFTSNTGYTLNMFNNSVLIDGTASSGNQNTYSFLRGNNTGAEMSTNINLRNNIFANRRTGGSGIHVTMANQATSPTNGFWNTPTSAYNLLVSANTATVAQWGLSTVNLNDWRTITTSDVLSYYVQAGSGAGQLNLNNLFINPTNGDLGLQTSNSAVWYVYGKGITGSEINNLNSDFSANARSTAQGIATTIGSVHMTSVPSMLPIAATASAAPAANTTTSYTFANRPVASIAWGSSAPTSATVYDFTGVNPPAAPAGNFNNRYVRADISGGTAPYNYGLIYNFNAANLGTTINGNNIRLATSNVAVPTSWNLQFTTSSNATNGIASVSGLSSTGSVITFTGTELTAPPTINAFVPSAARIGGAITIRGSLFTGATAVSFNGTSQLIFTVVNDTTITTTVPIGATTGTVSVTNPFGTGTSVNNFTVIPAPTIASFSPASGTFGTAVTITGTGFTWATGVKFNGISAPFTIVNNTTINTSVPTGASTGLIRVINPADSIESISAFNVFGIPVISSLSLTSGSVGSTVTITGTGFNAVTAVRFNGVNASYIINSTTSITVSVPSGASTGNVTVVNGSGTSNGILFTVTTPPTINSFSPSAGGVGSAVVITGTNFIGADTVWFNTTPTTVFVINSATQITVNVPTGASTGLLSVRTPQGLAVSSSTYTVYTDLIVSTNTSVSGIYNNITVTSTGTANIGGTLTALGNVVVQTGGTINFGTNSINGLGNFTSQSGSRLTIGSLVGLQNAGNTGNIQLNGTRTINPGTRVEFNGTGNQLTGNLLSSIDTLIVNVIGGELTLQNNLSVNNRLDLIGASIVLGANNLSIGATGSIINANTNNYIKTNGSGSLRRTVQNNSINVAYPVGSSSSFTPAQVQLNGTSTTDVISVRVFDGVLTGSTTGTPIASSMVNRTWVINENVIGGSNATITLQWNGADEVGSFNRTLSAVSRYNTPTNKWTYLGTTFGAALGSDPYTRSITGITSLTAFTVGDSFATSLPVNLISFTAKAMNNDVLLSWSTASEQNNKGFAIERSADGENFSEIDFVNGKDFSLVRVNYKSLDQNAFDLSNSLYYRLRQVDFDGTETFSNVVSVTRSSVSAATLNAYPNPFAQDLSLEIVSVQDESNNLIVTDLQGRMISARSIELGKGINVVSMDELKDVNAGIYFIKLIGVESRTIKVVKTN
jgi:hypothetical protein